MKIIKKSAIKINQWSGGTTSELFIYPPKSNYKKLDFLFRLSRATVEVKTSTFTSLPKVSRKLMILEGEIEIKHKNRYSKLLKPFDYDDFMGDWNTTSTGKATDFNLMMQGNTKGEFEVIKANQSKKITVSNTHDFTVLYVANGTVNHKEITLCKSELIVITPEDEQLILLSLEKDTHLIITRIYL